jgi:RNA polymerase sigma factor for flagellar operon FliA
MRLPEELREEFISAGLMGLVEAADRFDPERGFEFRGFAYFRIRGAILDHLRAGCELSGQGYRMLRALEAAHSLQREQHEGPVPARTPGEDRKLGHAIDYLTKSAVAYKLVNMVGQAAHVAPPYSPDDPELALTKKRDALTLRRCLATLPEKERTIIEQHYFHDLRLVEVAERHAGLSKSWVSRLHDRALVLLRDEYLRQVANAPSTPSRGANASEKCVPVKRANAGEAELN